MENIIQSIEELLSRNTKMVCTLNHEYKSLIYGESIASIFDKYILRETSAYKGKLKNLSDRIQIGQFEFPSSWGILIISFIHLIKEYDPININDESTEIFDQKWMIQIEKFREELEKEMKKRKDESGVQDAIPIDPFFKLFHCSSLPEQVLEHILKLDEEQRERLIEYDKHVSEKITNYWKNFVKDDANKSEENKNEANKNDDDKDKTNKDKTNKDKTKIPVNVSRGEVYNVMNMLSCKALKTYYGDS